MTTPFTRRDFLKAGGAVLATAALPSTVRSEETAPPAKANKRDIKKGIMWACVSGSMSVMDKFKMIREAGFACCASCYGGANPPVADPYVLSRIGIAEGYAA